MRGLTIGKIKFGNNFDIDRGSIDRLGFKLILWRERDDNLRIWERQVLKL